MSYPPPSHFPLYGEGGNCEGPLWNISFNKSTRKVRVCRQILLLLISELINFNSLWNHQKTCVFLLFQGEQKLTNMLKFDFKNNLQGIVSKHHLYY